jgi:hypothetical protein
MDDRAFVRRVVANKFERTSKGAKTPRVALFSQCLWYTTKSRCRESAFLSDSDVDGQVVHTLLKMRAGGYAEAVAPLLQSEKPWIRRLAKKYVERYPG